jgi:hypothetical protein
VSLALPALSRPETPVPFARTPVTTLDPGTSRLLVLASIVSANRRPKTPTSSPTHTVLPCTVRCRQSRLEGASVTSHHHHHHHLRASRATASSDELVSIHAFGYTFGRALFNPNPSSRVVDLTTRRPCRLILRVRLLRLDHYDARHVLSSPPGGHATRRTPWPPRNAS